MLPNDRKRTRGDTPGRLASHSSSSSTTFLGPLQARAVNTTLSATDGAGAQGKLRQPLRKHANTAEPPSQSSSGSAASERSSTSSQPHNAQHSARGRPQQPFRPAKTTAGQAAPRGVHGGGNVVTAATTARGPHGSAPTSARSSLGPAETALRETWRAKREGLEEDVRLLRLQSQQLSDETEAVEDAIEGMLTAFESDKRGVEDYHTSTVRRYQGLMAALRAREDVCLANKQRALTAIDTSKNEVRRVTAQQEAAQEAIILATDQREALAAQLTALTACAAQRLAELQALQGEEEKMKDASYGLTGEVRELVLSMERLKSERQRWEVSAMEKEVARRELYSLCEELKGSIRVYCRVKGAAPASAPVVASAGKDTAEADGGGSSSSGGAAAAAAAQTALSSPGKAGRTGSVESTVSAGVRSTAGGARGGLRSGRSTTRSSVATAMAATEETTGAAASVEEEGNGEGERCLFSFPDRTTVKGDVALSEGLDERGSCAPADTHPTASAAEGAEEDNMPVVAGLPWSSGRTITLHQTRSNATSTGISNTEESFTYDRVFTGAAQQEEVYHDVEPLVRNAVDGYRVCVFAYGQTGSGKTFTMEGDLHRSPAAYGVTPRALLTILQRQRELAREGWSYELSCTFIEIYNDVIRDLFQSGSARYEAAMQQGAGAGGGGAGSYHTIKHTGVRTHITNVSEKRLQSMDEFFTVYQRAVDQRSTAKTELNDKSSRSHCIFTLHITGTNATIRQRSEGVLCLVDLAGSERVNESGVQGMQFKEAVNINRSLLDLGKCIRALRSGAVVPWRNCKLTYLLQNYLGAKGAKMLMIVTVSNLRQHAPESMNSLRFADRVQETFVGTSVKRVVNMM